MNYCLFKADCFPVWHL